MMPPDAKTVMQPIAPVVVTVVGSGTGDGGAPISNGMELHTPDHQPNVIIQVITPLIAISVRFGNAYITTLVGLLAVGLPTGLISAPTFLDLMLKYAGYSLSGPIVDLLKNLATILGGLEKKYPLMTGSV